MMRCEVSVPDTRCPPCCVKPLMPVVESGNSLIAAECDHWVDFRGASDREERPDHRGGTETQGDNSKRDRIRRTCSDQQSRHKSR